MYRYLIAILIALTAAMLPAQTTPRNGATQSAGKTSLTPASPRSTRSTSGSSREAKPQRSAERSATQSGTGSRTESAERSSSGSQDATLTPKGSYRPGSAAAATGTTTTNTRSNTTRPAYSNPTQARNAPRLSADRKKTQAKPDERVTINWMTLEEAMEKNKTEKRKIFVDVYTTWCGWCKHMDSTTFVNGAVAKYLNEHYYPVKFNAEQQNDIVFKDKTYHFKKSGNRGHHELAAEWLNNRLTFPTVVFLDENLTLIQPLAGYQDANKMEAIINYFGTDSHKKVPWESYEKKFVPQQ